MRLPIDKEFLERAKAEGLPMFRIQIDWRFVPKDKRSLKAHESCGYTSVEGAAKLLRLSFHELCMAAGEEESQPMTTQSSKPTEEPK